MKVIVLTSSNAVLTDESGRVMSIITCNKDINSKLEKSIKEHYTAQHVKIIDNNEILTNQAAVSFKAEVTEEGETCIRDFSIEIVATY